MIYWVTGAIGSGKTTLGAALASHLEKTLFIDGDYIIPDNDQIALQEQWKRKEDALLKKCMECIHNDQSVVMSYPISHATAKKLRQVCRGSILIIGISNPADQNTRGYSEWEKKRRIEMIDSGIDGKDFADIYFEHPTCYLYDSVERLLQKIKEKQ